MAAQNGAGLDIEPRPPLAVVRLDRPAVRNAISYELAGRMRDALEALAGDPQIRVVILTGGGDRAFISGADVTEFRRRLATAEGALDFDSQLERLARTIEGLSKPVIAMIRGAAVGSGLLLALACDLRIAASDARFGVPVSRIGLIPSAPDLRRLARFAGVANAKWLLMTGELVGAERARAMGLVDHLAAPAALLEETERLAGTLAERAPLTVAAVKSMLADAGHGGTEVNDAAALYRSIYASEDFAEGVSAFLERRPPQFRGR